MKFKKSDIRRRFKPLARTEFDSGADLTSYAGLIVVDALFGATGLREKLRRCFPERSNGSIYSVWRVVLLLVVHVMLGFRRIAHCAFYREDPMVQRIVGVSRIPDERVISRTLAQVSAAEEDGFDRLLSEMATDALERSNLPEVTVDFDGSVQSTCGHAEATAVGFNKTKKGARSYYPLFATIAETSQFLAMHHRSGNVHDSNGACEFIDRCVDTVRRAVPHAALATRFDSAFFSRDVAETLRSQPAVFTMSVPFARLPELKGFIEQRQRWRRISPDTGYFETNYAPKNWPWMMRFLFVRHRRAVQRSGPLQLDLFEPVDHVFEYQVIVTNSTAHAAQVLLHHHGRGAQEKLFGEAKQHAALDVVATKRVVANRMVTRVGMLAHNLGREVQMRTQLVDHPQPTPKRTACWRFQSLGTIANTLIHRAGRFVRPQGKLTLRVNANPAAQQAYRQILDGLAA